MNDERPEIAELLPGIPPDACAIALVGSAGDTEAAGSAIEAAKALGASRNHVLLASLEGPRGELDEAMGVAGGPGFSSVLRGAARIPEIAARGSGDAFVYLPHGDDPAPAAELLRLPRLRALVDRLRGSGGTLLLYLPTDGILDEDADFVDVVVRLERREPEALDPDPDTGLEAKEPAGPEPMTAQLREAAQRPVEEEAENQWRRHQPRRRFPVVRLLLGLLIVAALPVGWWAISQRLLSRAESAGTTQDGANAAATPASGAAAGLTPAGQSSSRQDWDEAIAAAPALPFSVLLASYASWRDAIERQDELQTAGSRLYFIAPTPLGGALYYRVFAGATSTADSAAALMEELVRLDRKETVSEWDIRPVGLAFALGVYPSRVEAEAFEERLAQQRIPAYILPVAAEGDSAFQVFAGGFESAAAAEALGDQLENAGWQAELIPRRGVER